MPNNQAFNPSGGLALWQWSVNSRYELSRSVDPSNRIVSPMPDDRSFRVDETDVDELRDQTRNQRLIESFAHWVRVFAPRVDDVIAQIEDAFAGTQLGEGIGLFEANGLDDYASEDERRKLRSSDEKHDWKRIARSDLNKCYTSPWFFDAKGFVFHLPAFLIAELNDQHPYGFIDRLFRTEEHPQGWRNLLTAKQRDAIIATLILIREHPNYERDTKEIDVAIESIRKPQESG